MDGGRSVTPVAVDGIDCSTGGTSREVCEAPRPVYQVPYAEGIRRDSGIMTMAVGLITDPHQAEEILQEGRADLVALGREMLLNPNWPLTAAASLGVPNPFGAIPENYRFWLEKRAKYPSLPK